MQQIVPRRVTLDLFRFQASCFSAKCAMIGSIRHASPSPSLTTPRARYSASRPCHSLPYLDNEWSVVKKQMLCSAAASLRAQVPLPSLSPLSPPPPLHHPHPAPSTAATPCQDQGRGGATVRHRASHGVAGSCPQGGSREGVPGSTEACKPRDRVSLCAGNIVVVKLAVGEFASLHFRTLWPK